MLSVERLQLGIDGRAVLEDVSFDANTSEVVAVVGPNGAGKTTLLEAIAGLRPSSAGRIAWQSRALVSFRDRAAALAYMPDEAQLPQELDVGEVLASASGDILAQFGVRTFLARRANELSRGESKRVWLAATALLARPVALLDEPFGAFDPLQLDEVVAAVRATLGRRTVVASIHQMTTAERIADRILILSRGRVVAFGSLEQLRDEAGRGAISLDEVFRVLVTREAAAVALPA